MRCSLGLPFAALLIAGGTCWAQVLPLQGSAMTRPAEASWDEMQASLKAHRNVPHIPTELGGGGNLYFYPQSSALLPQSRERLAKELSALSAYPYPTNQYICNSVFWIFARMPRSADALSLGQLEADKRLARQRIQTVFTWLVDHGYERDLLFGELLPYRAGGRIDSVEYEARLGLFPAAQCEAERQKYRTSIHSLRTGSAGKETIELAP